MKGQRLGSFRLYLTIHQVAVHWVAFVEVSRATMAVLEADRIGHLYGTTKSGGEFNQGTVFEVLP